MVTRHWLMAWVAWEVVAVDDAAWVLVFLVVAADAPRKLYLLPLRCWATAKALDPPVPAAIVGTPGSTRSRTTIATITRDQAAADQTAKIITNIVMH